ncbi:MAG: amidohydrolase family protein [Candidatus Methanosuratincola sp.]
MIENARIWSDGRTGFAEFAAVRNGVFVYVGSREERFIGERTQRVDARGAVVIPGIIDSHIHMLSGGTMLAQLQLRDARDKADFIRRVGEWVKRLKPGEWVLGGRWSVESWENPEQPTKEWIDPLTPDNPVYLPRMDGHSALVNSVALRLAGITREAPPDPPGGVIDRHPVTREPTGILRESAMTLVSRLIPLMTVEQKVIALKKAMEEANRHGITAVSDIPSMADLPAYEELAKTDDLSIRFFLYLTASDWESAIERVKTFQGKPGWIEVRGFKGYMDGSLGSRTAYMKEPYLPVSDDTGLPTTQASWRGLLREGVADGVLAKNIRSAARNNYQTIVHAIGDEANHMLLNILRDAYGVQLYNRRCRSEHAQHLLTEDILRFGTLGVIASMQPYHKTDDGRYAESYIGAERCRGSYAFRSLLNSGAVVAFGSDWPVVTLNPFLGIESAVTGKTLDGKLWQTQENISVPEALRCYTTSSAYAVFAENEIGRIAPGYRADFVILNHSPFDRQVVWSEIRPTQVWVEGRRVY